MVSARKVVFATGYETQELLKQPGVRLSSTYALVSEPLGQRPWHEECLIWESARPYRCRRRWGAPIAPGGWR